MASLFDKVVNFYCLLSSVVEQMTVNHQVGSSNLSVGARIEKEQKPQFWLNVIHISHEDMPNRK